MLATTWFINGLFRSNEATIMNVYGGRLGTGKTAFAVAVCAELYHSFESVKKRIVWLPSQFVDLSWKMVERKEKDIMMIWDDAGLHLNFMDFNDPWVVKVIKYLNVCRSNWNCIMTTSPNPLLIVAKVRYFPDCYNIKVMKVNDEEHDKKYGKHARFKLPRRATAYYQTILPDLQKRRIHTTWTDDYDAYMPDDFYAWYQPIRDEYARYALLDLKDDPTYRKSLKDLDSLTANIEAEIKA